MFFWDWTYLLLIPGLILGIWAQAKVNGAYSKYSRVPSQLGRPASQVVADLLRRAKVEVVIASAMGRRALVSSHGIHLNADALAEDVDYSDVDMVVLPGGIPGTPNLAENKTVTDTCVSFAKSGKKVAAICAAPSVLASLGLLEGKNATAHAGFQDKLAGAIVHDEEVVVDGNITTSYGLGGAIPFALELVRQLAGPAEADRIQKAIAYRH